MYRTCKSSISSKSQLNNANVCLCVLDLMQEQTQLTGPPIPDVIHDQGHHEGGSELSYPEPHGIPSDSVQRFDRLENHLHSINSMLDMLKKQVLYVADLLLTNIAGLYVCLQKYQKVPCYFQGFTDTEVF